MLGTGLHNIEQGTDIGVKTSTHILNVKYYCIESVEIIGYRFFALAIQRNYRGARAQINPVSDFLTGIRFTPEAMFGSEYS